MTTPIFGTNWITTVSPYSLQFGVGLGSPLPVSAGFTSLAVSQIQSFSADTNCIFSLPLTNYAVEGTEFNLYWNNVIRTPRFGVNVGGYWVSSTAPNGTNDGSRFTLVPLLSQATNQTISLTVNYVTNPIATYTGTLRIASNVTANGRSRKLLIIGDSTTAGGQVITELTRMGGTNGFILTGIGTQGTLTNMHEGRSGYTLANFYTGSNVSPFTNGSGKFDFNFYLTNNSLTMSNGDYVLINLGINDVFGQTTDSGASAVASSYMTTASNMVQNITSVVSGVRVGLCLTIAPSQSQDAFGANYGSGQTYWRYYRNRFIFDEYLIANNTSGATLVPIQEGLDTINNMNWSTNAVNARNPIQVGTMSNGVHPATVGYYQIADQIWAWLKCME